MKAAVTPAVVGLSHRTAAVEIRERYAFDEEAAAAACRRLLASRTVAEAVLLSTCNRTELYFVPTGGEDTAREAIVHQFRERGGEAGLRASLFYHAGADCYRHLFRVTASLDSMVLGEPQILGQVKAAFRLAASADTVGPVLSRVFERAFKVAKDVRSSTGVGTGTVSVGSIAVDLARQVFGDLRRCTLLLVGAGKMAEAAARTLAGAGTQNVRVANRTLERAIRVAGPHGWEARPLDDLDELLGTSDIVIASVAFPGHLISSRQIRNLMLRRRFRPVFLIDVSVPRVIDPAVADLENVYAYDIDDFNQIVETHLKRRALDLDAASDLVERETHQMERWLREQQCQPTIAALRAWAKDIRDREVGRAIREMGDLTEAQRKVIEALGDALVNRLLHDPTVTLRESAAEVPDLAAAVRRLFRLDQESREKRDDNPDREPG